MQNNYVIMTVTTLHCAYRLYYSLLLYSVFMYLYNPAILIQNVAPKGPVHP